MRTALAALLLVAGASLPAWAAPIPVVAAENFYGDIARQVGGAQVAVTSILSNPDQDPHLFEASASVARNLSGAKVAVYNGVGYDPWMAKLLGASNAPGRTAVVAGELIGKKAGDNPHIWYDPATMRAVATALATAFKAADPAHAAEFDANAAKFDASLKPIDARIAALKAQYAGTPVIATEPVFGYMFALLGMTVQDEGFALSVQNNTEPSASDVAAFETALKTHAVKLMLYNSQASDPVAVRMKTLATRSHVPVVGATETEPAGKTYQVWLGSELDAVEHALKR